MVSYELPVRFDDIDAAGIVFFGRFANFVHEAMENFFSDLEGGHAALIRTRRIGLPTVRFDIEFHAPLRYGDRVRIDTTCAKLGRTSATLSHRMHNSATGELCATVQHIVVTVDLDSFRSAPMPSDVRQKLAEHG